MSLRFRRSVRLAPGLRLNLGLRGPSLSVGPRGLGVTVGPAGVTSHVGVPGTGLSYRTTAAPPHAAQAPSAAARPTPAPASVPTSALPAGSHSVGGGVYSVSVQPALDEHGHLLLTTTDGSPLDPRIERHLRGQGAERLQAWLAEHCAEINGGFDALAALHRDTPAPGQDHHLAPEPFAPARPEEPQRPERGGWDRIFPWGFRRRMDAYEHDLIVHRRELECWEQERADHDADWERRRRRSEDERLHSPEAMHDLLAEALGAVPWPRETLVRFDVGGGLDLLHAEIDLPELEDMPAREAEVAARGLKLNIHERSPAQVRKAYAAHVHAVVFRVTGVAFATLPTVRTVIASGFTQRADAATGRVADTYVISVRVGRDAWAGIDFANLAHVDPVAALARFELRSHVDASGAMAAIEPFAP